MVAPSAKSSSGSPHEPALDGIRGIAVVLVMLHHFVGIAHEVCPTALDPLAFIGWIGVDIFFVLSGFLITRILIHTRERPHYFRNFYARRSLRIFPLYFLTVAAVFAISYAFEPPSESATSLREQQAWIWLYCVNYLSAFTHTHLATAWFSMNHFWSLAIEEQFYLVWPSVIRFVRSTRFTAVCVGVAAVSIVARFLVSRELGGRAGYLLTFARLDTLMIGALLAVSTSARTRPMLLGLPVRMLGLCGAVAIVGVTALRHGFSHTDPLVQLVGYPAVGLVAAGLIGEAIRTERSWIAVALEARVLVFFGAYSYGLYVFHGVLRPLLTLALGAYEFSAPRPIVSLGFLIVAFGASLALAIASYHLMEKRFLRLKDRFVA